jgi:PTH1 family peptidyl-tRNA hydrolase
MKLIVGLGNPGRGYANNRHNLGFMCVGHFARTHNIRFNKKKGRARIGVGKIVGIDVVIARPQTYMNRSGESVSRLVRIFNISLDNLLVVHDELDLPLGKIRIRQGGSSAGHKGVESIIAELGSQDFLRLRVGIGKPTVSPGKGEVTEDDIIKYLLNNFFPEEKKTITKVLPVVSEAILCIFTEGLTTAMNRYN